MDRTSKYGDDSMETAGTHQGAGAGTESAESAPGGVEPPAAGDTATGPGRGAGITDSLRYPKAEAVAAATAEAHRVARRQSPATRLIYIILALTVGHLGVHNFYARRVHAGAAQLLLNLLGAIVLVTGIRSSSGGPQLFGAFVLLCVYISVMFNITDVDTDGEGRPFG
jgi:hypothetical protein